MENRDYKQRLINRSYDFSLEIMKSIDGLPKKEFSIYILAKQLIKSATSIGANIVEAQASSSRRDFTNFISYALKSANETKYWLGLLGDSEKIDSNIASQLLTEATELSNLLGASILSLKGKR